MSGMMLAFSGGSYGAAPVNTVAPVVSGTATVGQTLSTTNGTWTGAPAPTFTYQWQRTGVDIGGATSSTYVLVAADYANTIRCVVKATNAVSPAGVTANSNSTASVAGTAPVNTVAPVVSGSTIVAQTLSTTNGTWTGAPTPTFTYQWQRVTTNISGATSSTYVLVAADVGSTIRCVVTATNAISAVSANSNSTAAVTAVRGCQSYTSAGSYTFTVPAGVTSYTVVTVATGGNSAYAGMGGRLEYANNYSVTPGQSVSIVIPVNTAYGCYGTAPTVSVFYPTAGFNGGYQGGSNGGGGGAGGYAGPGGDGGIVACCGYGGSGSGGGGGGGGTNLTTKGGGGGVGIFGQGSNGAAGSPSSQSGGGGSGGSSGGSSTTGGSGGTYGGGRGAGNPFYGVYAGGAAVRILWPGNTRSFPSTCVS